MFCRIVLLLMTTNDCHAAAARADGRFLFTSDRGHGDGLHLSYSENAREWVDLGRTFLEPAVGGRLLRDSHILPGADGLYRMVWTSEVAGRVGAYKTRTPDFQTLRIGPAAIRRRCECRRHEPMDPLTTPFPPGSAGEPVPATP